MLTHYTRGMMSPTPQRALRLDQLIRTSHRKAEARSPQQQRDIAAACAATNGYVIPTVHDSGRSESGKTMDRASVHAAMDRVRAGLTDGVIVALTDRVGRAPIEEVMSFMRELHSIGGVFVPADGGGRPIDLADPQAETNLVFQLQMARQFWLTKAQGFKRSQRDAIKAGKFVGPTPLGYVRDGGRLYEHDVYGPVIREAYRLAAREGLHAAMAHLERHVPERRWDMTHVRRLLGSRAYLGESRSGELSNLNAHEPLTTPGDWQAAQTEPHTRRSNGHYPLSHVAVCGRCGAGLVGGVIVNADRPRSYRRMRCSAHCKGGCSISADRLEGYVRDAVADAFTDATFRLRLEPVGKEQAEAALEDADARLEQAVRTAARLEGRSRRARELADAEVDQAEAQLEAAEGRLREIAATCSRREDLPSPAEIRADDVKLLRAIRAGVPAIRVLPGRGSVEQRVFVGIGLPDDFDQRAGMLAA